MSSRRPPLHTCGVSVMVIADNACKKAQQINGPSCKIANKIARIASFASPFFYAIEYQLLIVLSFLDNQIFALERVAEAVYPPSGYAFDKIDELVRSVEILPGKFDEAMNKFPEIVHQVPMLDQALFRTISFLKFFLSIFVELGLLCSKEKEILIDMNCIESSNESDVIKKEYQKNVIKEDEVPTFVSSSSEGETGKGMKCGSSSEGEIGTGLKCRSSSSEGETGTGMKRTYKDALEKAMKASYKDALEKGTKENVPKIEDVKKKEKKEGKMKNSNKKKENGAMAEAEIKSGVGKEVITEGKTMKKMEKKEEGGKEIRKSKEAGRRKRKKQERIGKHKTRNSIDASMELIKEGEYGSADKMFESAWLASPRKNETSSLLPRSVSYEW